MRKLVGVKLLVISVALLSLGFVGASGAHAQGTTVTTFSPGGTVAVTNHLTVITASNCDHANLTPQEEFGKCLEYRRSLHFFDNLLYRPTPGFAFSCVPQAAIIGWGKRIFNR